MTERSDFEQIAPTAHSFGWTIFRVLKDKDGWCLEPPWLNSPFAVHGNRITANHSCPKNAHPFDCDHMLPAEVLPGLLVSWPAKMNGPCAWLNVELDRPAWLLLYHRMSQGARIESITLEYSTTNPIRKLLWMLKRRYVARSLSARYGLVVELRMEQQ